MVYSTQALRQSLLQGAVSLQDSPAHPNGGEVPQVGMVPQMGVVPAQMGVASEGYYTMPVPGGLYMSGVNQQQVRGQQQQQAVAGRSRSQAIPIVPPNVSGCVSCV